MDAEKILEHTNEMYDHLMEASEIAGSLRDSFSAISNGNAVSGKLEYQLKEYTNIIRGKIYELREFRGKFKEQIKEIAYLENA